MDRLLISRSERWADREIEFVRSGEAVQIIVRIEACGPGGNFPAYDEIMATPGEARALLKFLAPKWLRWML